MPSAKPGHVPSALAILVCAGILGTIPAPAAVQILPGDHQIGPSIGTQVAPAVAAGGAGFLAVWQDYRTSPFDGPPFSSSGRGSDIYAMRLDSAGIPIDPAPLLIDRTFGDQTTPQVAWNGENWLVAWQTPSKFWSYSSIIRAVRISSAGVILDQTPIVVSTKGSQRFSLTANGSEWLMVVDSMRGYRVGPEGQVLNPGGTQLFVATTLIFFNLVSAQGEYLLVWNDTTSPPANMARRYAADLTPIGPAFPVPGFAVASSGQDYFFTWVEDSTYWDDFVYGQRMSLDGTLGPRLTLAGTGGGIALWNPAQVAAGWDGMTWWASWGELDRGTVFCRVTPGDAVLDFGGLPVNPGAAARAMKKHVVAGRPGGGAQFAWQDAGSAGEFSFDVFSAGVDAAGAPSPVRPLSTSSRAQLFADMAPGGSETLAVFLSEHSGDRRILGQRLGPDGVPLDAQPFEIAAGTGVGRPHVGFDGTRYMVVWSEAGQVLARRILPDATLLDPVPLAPMVGASPDVAGQDGTFLVVATQPTISIQFYHPFSMRVDGATGANLDAAPVILGQYFARYPRVIPFDNRWLATWQRNFSHDDINSNLMAAFVEADGTTAGEFIYGYAGGVPDVAPAGDRVLFVWRTLSDGNQHNDLVGRIMFADGSFAAPAFNVSAGAAREYDPSVTWNGTEFVVAWTDMRSSIIYFDMRSEVFAARVETDGTVVDPSGFAAGDLATPELLPAVASLGGRTLIAGSSYRDDPALQTYRIVYEVLGDGLGGNRWPVAAASASPARGDAPLTVVLDAVGSEDPDGAVASIDWSFGDGGTGTGTPAGHTYQTPEDLMAVLTVTDDLGASTSNTARIVADPVNQLPIAVAAADSTTGRAPFAVVFNARDAYDPDDGIQNYRWDFGDGGTYWGSTAYHTFSTPGAWTNTLSVFDFRGGTATATIDVAVGPPNQLPAAAVLASVLNGPAPLSVVFDGSGSTDPDGTIVSYAWSFGDGATASGPAAAHVYASPGTYAATLTVTDSDSGTTSGQAIIAVGAGPYMGLAISDLATPAGSVSSGSYMDTRDQNDLPEALTETRTSGSPSSRRSLLEHVWSFDVGPGPHQSLFVDAYHTDNLEGDDFLLEYSTDQVSWTPMLIVAKTADDDTIQTYVFPEDVSGTLYIRAADTDRTAGSAQADTLYVDEMYILSTPSTGRVGAVDQGTGQGLQIKREPGGSITLTWAASCVSTDTDFSVYAGELGGGGPSHVPLMCSTAGLNSVTIQPSSGNVYYLVVPHDGAYEGSHSTGPGGMPGPAGPVRCYPPAPVLGCN